MLIYQIHQEDIPPCHPYESEDPGEHKITLTVLIILIDLKKHQTIKNKT